MGSSNGQASASSWAHLFFDDQLVAESGGVTRQMMPATRPAEPVLVPDRPWETDRWIGDSGVSVFQDASGTCHMWYMLSFSEGSEAAARGRLDTVGLDEKTRHDLLSCPRCVMCYAVSDDGIHWEKPSLGRFSLDGDTANNIVYAGRLGQTVFFDPTAPSGEQFKMIHGGGERIPHRLAGERAASRKVYHAIYGAFSGDGIEWRPTERPIIPWYTDTTNVAYWDDQRKRYVAFVRWNEGMVYEEGMTVMKERVFFRAVGRTESEDFRRFPPPECILRPPREQWHPYNTGTDYYNSAAMKYPFAPDAYFLFVSFFHHETGMVDVYLASSRDGIRYELWPEPFAGVGSSGAFDAKCVYFATGLVDRGGRFDLYYRGYSYPHHAPLVPRSSFKRIGEPVGIGRVQVRRDGFVARRFASSGGYLVTDPFELIGDRLEVNVDAGGGGWLRVAVLDEGFQEVSGYGIADAEAVRGNSTEACVSWDGTRTLGTLQGMRVRLRFEGEACDLYSVRTVL